MEESGHLGEDPPIDEGPALGLGQIAWLLAAVAFVIAAVVLLFRGDDGYAGVSLAVALAAAINLF